MRWLRKQKAEFQKEWKEHPFLMPGDMSNWLINQLKVAGLLAIYFLIMCLAFWLVL